MVAEVDDEFIDESLGREPTEFEPINQAIFKGLFGMDERETIDYLGLIPVPELEFLDYVGIYALQAISKSQTLLGKRLLRRSETLKRGLSMDECIALAGEVTAIVAPIYREKARRDGIDFISMSKLDENGNPTIVRQLKLFQLTLSELE